jgi:hypothetical protein
MAVDYDDRDLLPTGPEGAVYQLPPAGVADKAWWTALQRDLTDHLVASMAVEIPTNPELKLFGRVGESDADFAARCRAAATEAGDKQIAALTTKYERKLAEIARRRDTALGAVQRAESARTSSMASDLIGGLFGGRRSISASMRRASSAQNRVGAAQDKVEDLDQQLVDVQAELDAEVAAIRGDWDARAAAVERMPISLERTDVKVSTIGLVWVPVGP